MEVEANLEQQLESPNQCRKLWAGYLPKPSFSEFAFETFDATLAAKAFLKEKKIISFWDLAQQEIS